MPARPVLPRRRHFFHRALGPVAATLLILAVGTPAGAQPAFDQWQQVGPGGGPLGALTVDALDDDRWLALSGSLLLEKRGQGDWRRIGDLPGGTGTLLTVDGTTLFTALEGNQAGASTVLYLSQDDGATWENLQFPPGPNMSVANIVRAPTGMLFATTLGLWRWRGEDGWTELLPDLILDFDITPDGSLATALTGVPLEQTRRVLGSSDGGLTWAELGGLTPRTPEAVAVEGSFFYAVGRETNGDRFTASRLVGPGLWTVVPATGLPTARSFPTTLEALDHEGPTALFSYVAPQTFRSADLGRTWEALDFGVGAVSVQFSEVSRGRTGEFLANSRTGAWRSGDGGATWQEENAGLFLHFVEAVAVDPVRSDELYVRTSSRETFYSEDGGATWSRLPIGPAEGGLVIAATEPRTVLVGAENGWYRSADNGGTFALQQDGGASVKNTAAQFSVDPTDPRRIVAGGNALEILPISIRRGAHWWSDDAGATWARGAELDDSLQQIYSVTHDPFNPARVYLTGFAATFASEDGGAYLVESGGASVTLLPGAGNLVWTLEPDRFTPGRLLALTEEELIRSLDGGSTWVTVIEDPPFDVFSHLRSDPRVRDRFWAESGAGLWRSDDAGTTWQLASAEFPDLVNTFAFDPRFPRTVYAGAWRNSLLRLILDDGLGCDHPQLLCLSNERFVLESRWRDFEGREGLGQKADLTADTGYFWFFDPANVELVTKVLDGRGFNGNYWVFYGSLSNVEFELKVTDTESQQVVTYQNPSGNFASVGDTSALPELLGTDFNGTDFDGTDFNGQTPWRSSMEPTALSFIDQLGAGPPGSPSALKVEACEDLTTAICIGDRFRLSATWRDFDNRTGVGDPNDLTDDTAFFTFFSPTNVELMVKVLDGRGFNGRYWVFFASLSNVEFTLTVEDLETGAVRRYQNPIGNFASVGDTSAF